MLKNTTIKIKTDFDELISRLDIAEKELDRGYCNRI